MAVSQDIGLYDNDLIIDNGDFIIAQSDVQHVSDTIAAFPGWWKQNPPDGVGILQYVKAVNVEQTLNRSIKLQLQSDGYKAVGPHFQIDNAGNLTVMPNAVKL